MNKQLLKYAFYSNISATNNYSGVKFGELINVERTNSSAEILSKTARRGAGTTTFQYFIIRMEAD